MTEKQVAQNYVKPYSTYTDYGFGKEITEKEYEERMANVSKIQLENDIEKLEGTVHRLKIELLKVEYGDKETWKKYCDRIRAIQGQILNKKQDLSAFDSKKSAFNSKKEEELSR